MDPLLEGNLEGTFQSTTRFPPMCLPKTPKAPDPVAPVAPLAAPAPMALADSGQSRKETGVSQLRIAGRKASPDLLGSGAAATAGLTLKSRKDALDAAVAGSGG